MLSSLDFILSSDTVLTAVFLLFFSFGLLRKVIGL